VVLVVVEIQIMRQLEVLVEAVLVSMVNQVKLVLRGKVALAVMELVQQLVLAVVVVELVQLAAAVVVQELVVLLEMVQLHQSQVHL
jgi:hypothetical protein